MNLQCQRNHQCQLFHSGKEMTGDLLLADPTLAAQETELGLYTLGVFTVVPRTAKQPIRTRWVGVNKGDLEHPDVRMRLVTRGF